MTNALIIVDVQNDFISGSLAVEDAEAVPHNIVKYLAGAVEYDYIVTTQDYHIDPGDHFSPTPDFVDSWPMHCVAGTEGAELHEAIKDIDVHARFFKGTFSAAYSGFEGETLNPKFPHTPVSLEEWLTGHDVTEVDICGIATDFCVKATALDAVKQFETTVLSELTEAVSWNGFRDAVDEMREAGVLVK